MPATDALEMRGKWGNGMGADDFPNVTSAGFALIRLVCQCVRPKAACAFRTQRRPTAQFSLSRIRFL